MQWLASVASLVLLGAMTPVAKSDVTTLMKDLYFSIELPGHWALSTREERTGLFIYRCQDSDEQLTVSIFPARPRLRATELEGKLNEFIRIRRDAEQKGDPAMVLMDTKISHLPAAFTGFHQGRSGSGRLTGDFVIVNGTGIANFYYEAPTLPPKQFAPRIQSILRNGTFAD